MCMALMTTSMSLIPDERQNYAADAPDEQVFSQQRVSAERLILDPFQRDRNRATEL